MDWDKFLSTWMKRYDFTPEQQEAFLARFSEANQQKPDKQIASLLGISEPAFKKRMGKVYARVASDHNELQGEKKRKRGVLRGILREAFDQSQVSELPNPITGYAEVSSTFAAWDTFLQVWANRHGFTPEQRGAFVARFAQENQSKLDIQIYQSLKLGEAAFKKRMAEVYSKLARDYPVLGQATKGKRELLQTILQAAFGAQTNAQT